MDSIDQMVEQKLEQNAIQEKLDKLTDQSIDLINKVVALEYKIENGNSLFNLFRRGKIERLTQKFEVVMHDIEETWDKYEELMENGAV